MPKLNLANGKIQGIHWDRQGSKDQHKLSFGLWPVDTCTRNILNLKEKTVCTPDWISSQIASNEDLICIIQNCWKRKNLAYARHMETCYSGLEFRSLIGNYVVPMFVECEGVSHAQQTFDSLIDRNEHSWTKLISGYIECGQPQHAFTLYQKMQDDNISPTSFTVIPLLRICAQLKDLQRGRQIHLQITGMGLAKDVFVGSTMIDMYAKCGSLAEAQEVFDKLTVRNVVSWNALITGYAEHGRGWEALRCFEEMQQEGVLPNRVTLLCSLKACGSIGSRDKVQSLHAEIAKRGFDKDAFIGSTLIDAYAKCGSLAKAREVFSMLPVKNVVSWNNLIAGYTDNGLGEEALKCFDEMCLDGLSPDVVTFIYSLKACNSIGAINKGREIHSMVSQRRLQTSPLVGSALVDMYAKCGSLGEARTTFEKLPVQDVVSWTVLIAGYAEYGYGQQALECFGRMELAGVPPDAATYICSLKACGSVGAIDKGRHIHKGILQNGFWRRLSVGNALLDMYAKCGLLGESRNVFEEMPDRDVVSWTTLIAAYVENGCYQEGLNCFDQMHLVDVLPNAATFVFILKACGSLGALEKGRDIQSQVARIGLQQDEFVGSAMIDMYARCGSVLEARAVFDKLQCRNNVLWNAMMRAYSLSHEGSEAIECFKGMQKHGVKPDAITFTCLLTACSRANLVREGQDYFMQMNEEHGILNSQDHYTCMVDLFARSGYLYEAAELIKTAPHHSDKETWTALLTSCKAYGELELSLKCFRELVDMDSENAVSYTLMANVYASVGRLDDANNVEELRKGSGAMGRPANTLIEIKKCFMNL